MVLETNCKGLKFADEKSVVVILKLLNGFT